MIIHRITAFSEIDKRQLMDLYSEANRENIPYFYPDIEDEQEALQLVEKEFLHYMEEEFLPVPGNECWVLEENGTWISALRLYRIRERFFYLEAVETHPDHRRRGYGEKLLYSLIRHLKESGSFTLCDCVSKKNIPSIRLHEKCGFAIVSDEGMDYLINDSDERDYGMKLIHLDVSGFSGQYQVRPLTDQDIPEMLKLAAGNPLYYRHCPPFATEESLREDLKALPPGKTMADKFFVGYFDQDRLAAMLDLILGYPDEKTAFIGFFMTDSSLQGRGIGSRIIRELCGNLRNLGLDTVRLCWVSGNPQAEHFWHKNLFRETSVTSERKDYTLIIAKRELAIL